MTKEPQKLCATSKITQAEDAPIYYDRISAQNQHNPELSLKQLYTNDTFEIALVTEGSGVHQILNESVPCKEGDVFVILPHLPHGYFLSEDSKTLKLRRILFSLDNWFDGEICTRDSQRFCFGIFNDNAASAYAMLNSQMKQKIYALFDSIIEEVEAKKDEWQECTRAHLSLLLISLGRYVNRAIKNIPDIPPKEWKTICAVLRAVSTQFSETDFTLERVSQSLYVSKSHLSRLFSQLCGVSFSEYLKRVRMEHACELLVQTTLTVEQIVERCGLRDLPSFYKGFHSYANMTPHQYRSTYNSRQKNKNNKNNKGDKIIMLLNEISENLQKGKSKIVKELVAQAIEEGCAPADILNEGLLSGMNVVGEKFKNNEVYVPEVLVAARAMNMGISILKPYLAESGVEAKGKVCIGTVQGDLHDIGKNLVKMMMEGKGLEVVDLGVDVPAEKFVQTAIDEGCQVICCSALLTTTMDVMADVVKAAEAAGIRDKVRIMVGGAPVSQDYCTKIGADRYTVDAASAADAAVELCKA